MTAGPQGGGVAPGRFRIDTSDITRARVVVTREAGAMGASMLGIGRNAAQMDSATSRALANIANRFKIAEENARRFGQSDLGVIQRGLQEAATSASGLVVTLGAAGLVRAGVAAAGQIQRMNALMLIFSGSQQKANQRMAELRAIAERTGQSFMDVAEGALAILPAVGRNNVDLATTLSLVQRLALLDPAQGVQGAAFAIRELMSGTYLSLASRFELSKTQLKALVDAAKGEPQAILEGLDQMVSGMGLTQEAFEELNRSGVNAFTRLSGTVREALGTAFTPFLVDVLQPMATGIANMVAELNRVNPAILTWGAGITLAVAGARPLLLILSQLIAHYQMLVPLAAAGIGVFGGVRLAQGLADRGIGDQRLRTDSGEDPLAVVTERIKQAIVLAASTIADVAGIIEAGGIALMNAFTQAGLFLENSGLKLNRALSLVAEDLLRLVRQFDEADRLGQWRTRVTEPQIKMNQLRLNQGLGFTPDQQSAFDAHQAARQAMVAGIAQILFPAAEEVAQEVEAVAQEISPLQAALNGFASVVSENSDKIAETIARISELNTEFERESQRIKDDRAIAAGRDQFDSSLRSARSARDFQRNIDQEDADFWSNRARQISDHNQEVQDVEEETQRREAEMRAEFARTNLREAEDHGKRLAEIERDTREQVQDAAARLDATAVIAAYKNGNRRVEQEKDTYETQRVRRAEDFALQLQQLQENQVLQKQQRDADFQRQLADDLANFNLQRQRQLEARALQLADEAQDQAIRRQRQIEDYALQDLRRQEAHQRQISQLQAALAKEIGLSQQIVNVAQAGLATAGQLWANFVNGVRAMTATLSTSAYPGASSPRPTYTTRRQSGGSARGLTRMDELGMESALINQQHLAFFNQPATVFNASQTAAMLGGGRGGSVSIGTMNIPINLGDVGNRSNNDIVALIDQGVDAGLRTFFLKGRD